MFSQVSCPFSKSPELPLPSCSHSRFLSLPSHTEANSSWAKLWECFQIISLSESIHESRLVFKLSLHTHMLQLPLSKSLHGKFSAKSPQSS